MRRSCLLALALLCGLASSRSVDAQSALLERGRNPVIWADVPDPAVVRVDSVYYMVSTTMHMSPGIPIMRSRNLVDWEMAGYVYGVLANADGLALRSGQDAYGRGSWASSLRYRDGMYYVVTFSYTTGETYVFTTADIERGLWRRASLGALYHDPGLFFDGGRAYLVYGERDIRILELTADARAVLPGGVDRVLIHDAGRIAGTAFHVAGEGSHVHKVDGRYYVFIISWPRGGMRTQLVYRADSLDGPWEGRIVLQDEGIAQGGIVDTPDGRWYALLFGDRGAVGRIPYLVPVVWEDGWPILGVDGRVPEALAIPSAGIGAGGIVSSDEFDTGVDELGLAWQWNHNPVNAYWSLAQRPGHLRLRTDRRDARFVDTRNTLTQRTFGPRSSARTAVDVGGLRDGDVAGLGILQEHYAYVGVAKEGGAAFVVMVARRDDREVEVARVPLGQPVVHLRADADFRDMVDTVRFSYSLDGVAWMPVGDAFRMRYTLGHFMGARFALFGFATKDPGGWADFDHFRIDGASGGSRAW